MVNRRRKSIEEHPKPEPISIRTVRGCFGSLVDEDAEGRAALICRGATPLAVLLPACHCEEPAETVRRDQSLAAALCAHGIVVKAWTAAGVLEAVVRLIEGRRL